MPDSSLILAYDSLKDPRDLAEVLHLATGLGAEVHLIGGSLDPRHWKVLRKLRSWRPRLAEAPSEISAERFEDAGAWAEHAQRRGFELVAAVVEGGDAPWSRHLAPKTAVLFGEETHGLSKESLALCSTRWTIPLGPGGRFYTIGQATALVLGAALARGSSAPPELA